MTINKVKIIILTQVIIA